MKAYIVSDKTSWEGCSTVVFAETRGKAKAIALNTDACEDVEYIDIECYRVPSLDKYYKKGKKEMDWEDKDDRVALCKHGWACIDECFEPENCPAKKWCYRYQDEMNGENE